MCHFPPPPDCPKGFIYTVKPTDTLYDIALKFKVNFKKLKKANPQIKNYDLIFPGQKICVPKKKKPPVPPKPDRIVKLLKKLLALVENEDFGLLEIKNEIKDMEEKLESIEDKLDQLL